MGNFNYGLTGPSVSGAVDATIFLLAFIFGAQLTWRAAGAFKWDRHVYDTTGRDIRTLRLVVALAGGLIFGLVGAAIAICVGMLRVLF